MTSGYDRHCGNQPNTTNNPTKAGTARQLPWLAKIWGPGTLEVPGLWQLGGQNSALVEVDQGAGVGGVRRLFLVVTTVPVGHAQHSGIGPQLERQE